MTKKKLPNYKVEDLVRKNKCTYEIISITKEPTAEILNILSGQTLVVPFSELATYEHYPHSTRIGRPPKTRKTESVVVETEQVSTPSTALPISIEAFKERPSYSPEAPHNELKTEHDSTLSSDDLSSQKHEYLKIDEPTKVDLSTFELQIGTPWKQHKMTLAGKTVRGKDLKPTLLRLLEQFGITGSDAEIETALVLHPESEGRNQMLGILKGKKGG